MHILGISCYFHDAAACIFEDGKLIAAAQEERFTRKKHDFDFPKNAIDFCLEEGGLTGNDLDYVVFYEKPFIKFERILMSTFQTFPRSWKLFREGMITWLMDKLWVKGLIKDRLGLEDVGKIVFSEHHLSHAASSFYCSPFAEAAILTVDGVGEWSTTTLGKGKGNEIKIFQELKFPHSLGLLYSAFTAFLGFKVNNGEYKVMGMAPYGEPKYVDEVKKVVKINRDGSFSLNMDYFSFHYSTERTFNRKFESLFGKMREKDSHFFTKGTGYPEYFGAKPSNYERLCEQNQKYADIAASIQRVTEEIVLNMAKELQDRTGLKKLCIAGGVGLNSVANGRLLMESPFDEIYIQPAAGDSGGALGAALFLYHNVLKKERNFVLDHTYWGKEYKLGEVKKFLDDSGIKYENVEDDEKVIDRVVDLICKGKVIGWFQGRFEWGPRALGNRSIIADPRDRGMKDIVNTKIKFREPFRPFAPSVLVDDVGDYFDGNDLYKQYPTKFMLFVLPIKEGKREEIGAITHVNGTGRLQAVDPEISERYYRLIDRFKQKTGVSMILNTSFNLKGEPIVTSPKDALNTFAKSGMDYLVLENFLIDKRKSRG